VAPTHHINPSVLPYISQISSAFFALIVHHPSARLLFRIDGLTTLFSAAVHVFKHHVMISWTALNPCLSVFHRQPGR
jgi:hypothetical protein